MQIRRARFPDDLPAVLVLLGAPEALAGDPPTEETMLDLAGGAPHGLLAEAAGRPAGYAHLRQRPGGVAVEVALAAAHRDRAGALVDAALDAAGAGAVLWSGVREIDAAAARRGLREARSLLRLERALPLEPPPGLPPGLEIAPFDPGADLDAFLALNNAAFRGHPENGGWTDRTVRDRMARSWYDPAGFFLGRAGARVVGACWTKLHPGGRGEIYLVAVAPDAQGRGIGTGLIGHGLEYLHAVRGAMRGLVYTDGDNRRARDVYARLGFTVEGVLRCWGSDS